MVSGIIVATILEMNGLASAMFTMTFFLTVALWLIVADRRIGKLSIFMILIIMLSCGCVLIDAMITDTILSFSYLKKMLMFWSTLVFFATMCEYEPDKSVVDFVFGLNTLIVLSLLAVYYTRTEVAYTWNGRITNYLLFRFTNPNTTAAFLSALCMIEILAAYTSGKRLQKCMHLVLAGFMVFFVIKTRSRTMLILLLAFLSVVGVIMLFPRLKLKLTGRMAGLIAVIPLIFAAIYMVIIKSNWFNEAFLFLVSKGKELDSRFGLWSIAFDQIKSSPIIGVYSHVVNEQTHSQMHNTHLDVAASYGVPTLIMFIYYLNSLLQTAFSRKEGHTHFLCMVAFSAMLLTGVGEAMLFSGGLGIYIPVGIMLMLSNYDFDRV